MRTLKQKSHSCKSAIVPYLDSNQPWPAPTVWNHLLLTAYFLHISTKAELKWRLTELSYCFCCCSTSSPTVWVLTLMLVIMTSCCSGSNVVFSPQGWFPLHSQIRFIISLHQVRGLHGLPQSLTEHRGGSFLLLAMGRQDTCSELQLHLSGNHGVRLGHADSHPSSSSPLLADDCGGVQQALKRSACVPGTPS